MISVDVTVQDDIKKALECLSQGGTVVIPDSWHFRTFPTEIFCRYCDRVWDSNYHHSCPSCGAPRKRVT